MPKSRNRKKTQSLQKIPVIRKRETTFGIIKEHLGFKVVGIQAGQISRRKTELEKEAYRAWKSNCRAAKAESKRGPSKKTYIEMYLNDVGIYELSGAKQSQSTQGGE